jgi:hypothetical protein
MDFIELQQMIAKLFPDKKASYDFDSHCMRMINICMTDGVPHLYHQMEFNRVKMTIEGMDPQYVGIQAHRVPFVWTDIQKAIEEAVKMGDVFIPEVNVKELLTMKEANPELFEKALNELVIATGLDKEKIQSKLEVK